MENNHQINCFIQHFKSEIKKISKVQNSLRKKLLYSCVLDALATARYPRASGKGQYVKFLRSCLNWEIFDRVSIPQLILALEYAKKHDKDFCKNLLKSCKKKLNSISVTNCISDTNQVDEEFNELQKNLSKDEIKLLKMARYDHLFYTYRCSLVHGFRDPSYAMEDHEMEFPYYFKYANEEILHLGFPVKFIKKLTTKCIQGLETYLI